jgi:hypothetical protein
VTANRVRLPVLALVLVVTALMVPLWARPADAATPVISGLTVAPTPDGAVVTWTTDVPATTSVEYGIVLLVRKFATGSFGTAHSVTLTGLICDTDFSLRATSVDAGGDPASSAAFPTRTSGCGPRVLSAPVVGVASGPLNLSLWAVTRDGGVVTFGDAELFGSSGTLGTVGIARTPSARGYWLVASDGGVFAFGDAGFFGSTGGLVLNKPIVGVASTPSGGGYWLVASDGGVFAFGQAHFRGSTADRQLVAPIVAVAPTTFSGYRLFADDGSAYTF